MQRGRIKDAQVQDRGCTVAGQRMHMGRIEDAKGQDKGCTRVGIRIHRGRIDNAQGQGRECTGDTCRHGCIWGTLYMRRGCIRGQKN